MQVIQAYGMHPLPAGHWLLPSLAVATGKPPSMGGLSIPLLPVFPTDFPSYVSCRFCYRRFVVALTSLWWGLCSGLFGGP